MTPTQRQHDLEVTMTTRGVARYESNLERDKARGKGAENPIAGRFIRGAMENMVPAVARLQRDARRKVEAGVTSGRRLGGWEIPIQALPAEKLAYITVRTALVSADSRAVLLQAVAQHLGAQVDLEIRWASLQRAERDATAAREGTPSNRLTKLRRYVREVNPRSVRRWLKQLDDLENVDKSLPKRVTYQLGAALLATLLDTAPEAFERTSVRKSRAGKSQTTVHLSYTKALREELADRHQDAAVNEPWYLPMVCPPEDWHQDKRGRWHGGYLRLPLQLVKHNFRFEHRFTPSDTVVSALNAIQRTAWRVNTYVLGVAERADEAQLGPLPYEGERELPANIPAEEWEAMSAEQRGIHKALREEVHSHNNRAVSKRMQATRTLNVAREFACEDSLWFPHSLDWRGRAYPVPQDLQPQGDDYAKSMLTFAEAKPLGSRGLRWLMCYCAATYGLDKQDRDTQEMWAHLNYERLVRLHEDPFAEDSLAFWQAADEPWQFLAASYEVVRALSLDDPETYECSLPVFIDGTCNGLQHLSAMGLDPVGGETVNLLPGDRRDIYEDVAQTVREALAEDSVWKGKVTRATVKRGVMTVPYGLTRIGMRNQLIEDGHCVGMPDRMRAADELRDLMWAAIGSKLGGARAIMDWLQAFAEASADAQAGVYWETPDGSEVYQSYAEVKTVQVNTLLGRLRYQDPACREREHKGRKAALSVAPNVVHSFDASHMMLTVHTLGQVHGDMSFAMVHDSYGTHACDMDLLGHYVRETFVHIYSEDVLANLGASFLLQNRRFPAAVQEIAANPPTRGTLDITSVQDSTWFFA